MSTILPPDGSITGPSMMIKPAVYTRVSLPSPLLPVKNEIVGVVQLKDVERVGINFALKRRPLNI